MLHGLGGTTNTFQPQMETLRGYRVVRLDLPGSGRSPVPHDAPTFAGFCAAVVATLSRPSVSQKPISSAIPSAPSSVR